MNDSFKLEGTFSSVNNYIRAPDVYLINIVPATLYAIVIRGIVVPAYEKYSADGLNVQDKYFLEKQMDILLNNLKRKSEEQVCFIKYQVGQNEYFLINERNIF